MSFGDTRTLISIVLDSVTGVTGYPFRPAIVKTGSAWPTLEQIFRVPGGGDAWGTVWNVTVVLGSDEQQAAKFLDDLWFELVNELEDSDVCYVTGPGTTVPLPISGTQVQALLVPVTAD